MDVKKLVASGLRHLPKPIRATLVAGAGEFVGTFFFLLMAFAGAEIANETSVDSSQTQKCLYISLCFGFSLMVNAWIFYRVSGGLFNPAVNLALVLIKAITPLRAMVMFVAQILAGICAAAVLDVTFPGHHMVTTRLSNGTSVVRGLFIEMFLTSQLILAVLFLAAEKHKATFLAPVGIGLALFITQLSGVYYTGASLNPARSFGPDVAQLSFPGYHWIYWLGPALGSILATIFYSLAKALEYEMTVPGQDDDGCGAAELKDETSSGSRMDATV